MLYAGMVGKMEKTKNEKLMNAIFYDNVQEAGKLLEEGANPNMHSPGGESMLYRAALNNNIETVQLLLKHGAFVLGAGGSALELAIRNGNESMVRLLLDAGALPHPESDRSYRTIRIAFINGFTKIVGLLVDRGVDVTSGNLLSEAVANRDYELVEYLLSKGADVNSRAHERFMYHEEGTVLHLAVKKGNARIVKLLLDAKPRLDLTDEDDRTAYDLAVEIGKKEIIDIFEGAAVMHGRKSRKRRKDSEFVAEKISGTTFESVIGLDHVKSALYRDILYPIKHPELAKEYKVAINGGIVLFGPPGCGKTLIVRALAGEAGASIIDVRASDIYDTWVGSEGRNIGKMFRKARENTPCILFIDEIELLGSSRQMVRGNQTWMREALTTFLTELDGLQSDNTGVLVIGATNAPWMMDPALKRHGRLGKMLYVPPPDQSMKEELFRMYLKGAPLAEGTDYPALSKAAGMCNAADITSFCNEAVKLAWARTVESGTRSQVTMDDLLICISREKSNLAEWYQGAKQNVVTDVDKKLYSELFDAINASEASDQMQAPFYR